MKQEVTWGWLTITMRDLLLSEYEHVDKKIVTILWTYEPDKPVKTYKNTFLFEYKLVCPTSHYFSDHQLWACGPNSAHWTIQSGPQLGFKINI